MRSRSVMFKVRSRSTKFDENNIIRQTRHMSLAAWSSIPEKTHNGSPHRDGTTFEQ